MPRFVPRPRPWMAVAVLLLVVAAAACGSSSSVLSTVGGPVDPQPAPAAPDGNGTGSGGSGSGGAPNAIRDEARIVYTGSMSLQVDDLDVAVRGGRDLVAGLGGYVGASRFAASEDSATASITYRIPAAGWEDGLARFRALGTVVQEQTDAADVTAQIVDLDARIRNLRASETALQRIAEQATAIEDVLDVEKRLTDVRGQIEQLDAQRTNLADQAALGTLAVTYGREVVAIEEAARGWDAADEAERATATLVNVLQALTSAGIWFAIVWLPLLIALLVVALAARFVLRRVGLLGSTAGAAIDG